MKQTVKERALTIVQALNTIREQHLGEFSSKEFVIWSKAQGLSVSGAWLTALNQTIFKDGKVFKREPIDWKQVCKAIIRYRELNKKYVANRGARQVTPKEEYTNQTCTLNIKVIYV